MDNVTRDNLQNILNILTSADVKEVNRMLREVITRNNAFAKSRFSIGDTIEFTSSRTGYNITGTIMKKNPKTVEVRVRGAGMCDSQLWRVPPTMLRKVTK